MAETREQLFGGKLGRHWIWGFSLVLAIIAMDQFTKGLVLNEPTLSRLGCRENNDLCGSIEVSPPFDVSMTWNRGVSFGVFQAEGAGRWMLFAVTAAISAGFGLWLLRSERRRTALALSMVIGGAVGNMVDRAVHGAVVDFLDFRGLFFPWIFNIADAAISCGAILLLLDQLLASRKIQS
jgi:signal peptidase II